MSQYTLEVFGLEVASRALEVLSLVPEEVPRVLKGVAGTLEWVPGICGGALEEGSEVL